MIDNTNNSIDLHRYLMISQLDFAVFGIDANGPKVLFAELGPWEWLEEYPMTDFLELIALHGIVASTQGNNYAESVFHIPAGPVKDYVTILVTVIVNNQTKLHHENFRQLAIFLPKNMMVALPNLIAREFSLIKLVKSVLSDPTQSNEQKLISLRQAIEIIF